VATKTKTKKKAAKKVAPKAKAKKTAAKKTTAKKTTKAKAKKAAAKKATAKKVTAKSKAKKATAKKTTKAKVKKTAAKKATAKKTTKSKVKKTAVKKATAKKTTKSKVKKAAVKKTAAKSKTKNVKTKPQKVKASKKKIAKVQDVSADAEKTKKLASLHKTIPKKKLDPIIEKIRQRLISERSELIKILQNSKDLERHAEELNFSNEIDLASSLESREMAFTLSSRDRNELKLIDEALFRIENGTYGMCVDCPRGEPSQFIGLKRLEIMPLTTLCVECQEYLEKS